MSDMETRRLEDLLATARSLTDVLDRNQSVIREETSFADCIGGMMKDRSLKKSDVVRVCEIDRVYAYEVLRGSKQPSRDKVIMFAIGIHLPLSDCQVLIRSSGFSPLNAKVLRDAILIYSVANGFPLLDVNLLLDARGLEPLT